MAQMSSVPSSMTRPRAADATLFWDMITSPSGRSNKEASEQRVFCDPSDESSKPLGHSHSVPGSTL
jgi:hypothetical protein